MKRLDILQFTSNGVTHKELEENYWKALEKAYKKGLKDGQTKQILPKSD